LIFELFFKGDQLKVKLAKLKFSEIGDGCLFSVLGGRLVLGGRDYISLPKVVYITVVFFTRYQHPVAILKSCHVTVVKKKNTSSTCEYV